MAKAETEVKLQRLRKLLLDAQDLTRKSQERMNGLRFTLRERTREVINLRESLASQELLMSEDIRKARDRIVMLESERESLRAEIRTLRNDTTLLDTECDRKAEQINDLRQQLNRIPGWVRRLFRA